jgi:hypothetical protein
MFQPQSGRLTYSSTNLPNLLIIFPILFHSALNMTWIITSFNYKYPLMHVHTSHQCYRCPPFMLCPWHDAVCDTFVAVAQDFSFHAGWKPLHTLLSTMFHPFRQRVDIVLTKDGICTLFNVIIVDPTWMDLLRRSCTTQSFIAYEVAQAKKRSYHHWHPTNHFLLLAIEVFRCLDKQIDVFLHDCANVMSNFKGTKSLSPFFFVIFRCKKISITLQRMQASSILSWVVTVGLVTSQLPPLQYAPPITTTDLLQAVSWLLRQRDFDI